MDIKDVAAITGDPKATKDFVAHANEVISRPIPKELIKTREGAGKMQLSYIEGETVIKLLNEAFGETGWSFQIVHKYVMPAEPKQMTEWDAASRKAKKLFNPDGSPKMEAQPPIVEVQGRLVVPGFGVREQFGTKTLIGGSSEQEGASKAAATDALKKCATLFGIGLELYEDKPQGQAQQSNGYKKDYSKKYDNTPKYGATAPSQGLEDYPEQEKRKIKELKVLIGIEDNEELNPYVEEFTGSKGDTWEKITPGNIKAFNKFLEMKATKM